MKTRRLLLAPFVSFVPLSLLAFLALLPLSLSWQGCGGDPTVESGNTLVVAPQDGDPILSRLLDDLKKLLPSLGAEAPILERVASKTSADLQSLAAAKRAGLVLILDAHVLAPDKLEPASLDPLPTGSFRLVSEDIGSWPNRLGSRGATFLYLAGKTTLAKQYAVYEALRRLGARYYHPEADFLPRNPPTLLRDRAKAPTSLARKDAKGQASDLYTPDFSFRSFTFHGSHPLEHLEAFSDARHPIDEAARVNAWIIKQRGNLFRGAGRGIAPTEERDKRSRELDDLRRLLGFPRGAGITLHNEQQGASASVDRQSPVPPKQQIEEFVTKRLQEVPDAHEFGIHFGPTEFTTTPGPETIDWIQWAGQKALALKPDLRIMINNHTTGFQPMPGYNDLGCPQGSNADALIDYYDLSFHTDPRLGVRVHTVMFYPLEGPAFVYNQKTFAHKLCLMQKASAQGRPLDYFPEGSWWLSFDNPIPVYLPLYIWTRWRDIDLIKPLLASRGKGTLQGHRMFNSGHEWGYWQQDYAVGLWHWNVDLSLDTVLTEITDPFCPPEAWASSCKAQIEAKAVLTDIIDDQRKHFLDAKDHKGLAGGLYAYFAGEDPADEIAAVTGFEFRPVRVAFSRILRWDRKQMQAFQSSDIKALRAIEALHEGLIKRLTAVEKDIPAAGLPWFAEIKDGIEINLLRARQAAELYEAVLLYRETILANEDALKLDPKAPQKEPKAEASGLFTKAAQTLQAAEVVIRRREKGYRYPFEQINGGGFTPATEKPNGTTYPWRVHTKTHHLSYWTNRHEQVKRLMDGEGSDPNALRLSPTWSKPDEPLLIQWPKVSGFSAKLTIGGKSITEKETSVSPPTGDVFLPVEGEMQVSGQAITIKGGVLRSERREKTAAKGLTLTEPKSPLAQSVLSSLFPVLLLSVVAQSSPGPGPGPGLALATDLAGDQQPPFSDIFFAPFQTAPPAFETKPISFALPIPDPATRERALAIGLSEVVFKGTFDAKKLASPLQLKGFLSVEDLADALVKLAGFDRKGAYQTLGGVLGFDPTQPPSRVAFAAELKVESPAP